MILSRYIHTLAGFWLPSGLGIRPLFHKCAMIVICQAFKRRCHQSLIPWYKSMSAKDLVPSTQNGMVEAICYIQCCLAVMNRLSVRVQTLIIPHFTFHYHVQLGTTGKLNFPSILHTI